MRYPDFLREHGTIGLVAPAFGCNIEPYRTRLDNARRVFGSLGYGVKTGPNCYLGEGIGISNTPEACARELMEGYEDPGSDVLISCGGGELMCETISLVDFDRLRRARPKWYMGYSDNTNMTFLLNTLCDTAAVYGPNAASFGSEPMHSSLKDALGILTGSIREVKGYDRWEKESRAGEDNPLAPYHLTEDRILKLWDPAEGRFLVNARYFHGSFLIRGRMIGGCMDCLVNLLGTRFDKVREYQEKYKEEGFIWFLESCDLNVFAIRRAMWQMEEAGWFRYVKGFLIGRPLCFGQEMMGLDAYEAILHVAEKYGVPVILDADLGHLPPAMPIVSGSIAKLEVLGNDIRIAYEYR